jgi:hypothetical protein
MNSEPKPSVRWEDSLGGVISDGLAVEAATAALEHVRASILARAGTATQALAADDPEGNSSRVWRRSCPVRRRSSVCRAISRAMLDFRATPLQMCLMGWRRLGWSLKARRASG